MNNATHGVSEYARNDGLDEGFSSLPGTTLRTTSTPPYETVIPRLHTCYKMHPVHERNPLDGKLSAEELTRVRLMKRVFRGIPLMNMQRTE